MIFGGGAEFATAKKIVADHELSNVIIHDLLPSERVSEVYSLGDIALITCKKGVGKAGMPSKTWSIMACNTSIIASFDVESDLARVIKRTNAGITIEPENVNELTKAILNEYITWKNGGKSQMQYREYVEQYDSKSRCVSAYIKIIKDVVTKGENIEKDN